MSNTWLILLIPFGVGYLLGSIPFGLLLTRAAGLGDVRKIGSGSIGATNVLRTGSKKLAAATVLLDGLKGTAAVLIAGWLLAPQLMPHVGIPVPTPAGVAAQDIRLRELLEAGALMHQSNRWLFMMTAGLGAFIGHVYPVWLGFKGGKGVATYIGVLLGLAPVVAAAFCAVWLLVATVSRYSSFSALVASALAPLAAYALTGSPLIAMLLALMTLLLFWAHRENIQRLLNGTESKIGAKAKPTTDLAA